MANKGSFQIIRDTLRGGGRGVEEMSHRLFLIFKMLFEMLLEAQNLLHSQIRVQNILCYKFI
jgi:hypothetical protein